MEKKIIKVNTETAFLVGICISTFAIGIPSYMLHLELKRCSEAIDKLATFKGPIEDLEESTKQLSNSVQELSVGLKELAERIENLKEQKEKTSRIIDEMGIDYYNELLKLHSKILPIINTNQDTNILQIGDFVNLVDKNTPIYSDISMQEELHSYYGTDEVRLVQEIIMEKDGIIANVNNMDDYEILEDLGYQTIGYTLANQYSLDEQGNITTELRCKKDSVKGLMRVLER